MRKATAHAATDGVDTTPGDSSASHRSALGMSSMRTESVRERIACPIRSASSTLSTVDRAPAGASGTPCTSHNASRPKRGSVPRTNTACGPLLDDLERRTRVLVRGTVCVIAGDSRRRTADHAIRRASMTTDGLPTFHGSHHPGSPRRAWAARQADPAADRNDSRSRHSSASSSVCSSYTRYAASVWSEP